MAYRIVSSAAYQGRCLRAGQQDRAHGLGDNDQGRTLEVTRRTSGVKEIMSATSGVMRTVGRANSTSCRAGRSGDQDNPFRSEHR